MWRIVDISENGRHLSLERNSLVVSENGSEIGRVPIQDIHSVVMHGYRATLSANLIAALAEACVPLVVSGANHHPVAITLPVAGNFEIARRIEDQIALSDARSRRIWQQIVRAKILSQSEVLQETGRPEAGNFRKLAALVEPGDPKNVEARAAREYWPRLFGNSFRRDRDRNDLNTSLNYGYAIMRAAVARAVVSCGLCPSVGLHHRGRLNAFQLVDDLMEPFRPIVDLVVWRNRDEWQSGLTVGAKRALARLIEARLPGQDGLAGLPQILVQVAMSLCGVHSGERPKLWLPPSYLPVHQEEIDFDG